ncbi:hypothetical protein JX265_007110 [Neoarthrinium moseri]|uniref:Rhodopsin domain-containing protein n=1 Tax=Neoarthrinium moseri TaxID=1658444 RepID=A0A9Q0ANX4_9PEZI|nr:hypothetical protein JX265_007110 [Neoarthrinium moseri]
MANSSNTTSLPTIPFQESPDYKGHEVLSLNAALIACTSFILALRLYVRSFMSKALGVDDLFAVLAYGCLVALSAFEIRSVQFGSGAHIQFVPGPLVAHFFESLVNNTLIYFFGTGLMRLSIVAFLPRLAQDLTSPIFNKLVYGIGIVIIVQTLGCFFYRLTECTPIKDIWLVPTTPGLNCVSPQQENSMMVGHQAVGIMIDFALLALPIWVVHTKMLFSQRKIQVILVFSVGVFVLVTGIIRIVMLKTLLFLEDLTFNMSTIGPWTDLEGHVGLWCASFPALQPILRIVAYKIGLRSALYSYDKDPKSGNTGNGTSSVKWAGPSRSNNGYVRKGSGIDADDGSEKGIISSNEGGIELGNLNSMDRAIHRKVEVDVSVEEAPRGKRLEQDYGHINGKPNQNWADL